MKFDRVVILPRMSSISSLSRRRGAGALDMVAGKFKEMTIESNE